MNKKFKGFQIKPIFRLLVALGVIAFAVTITAVNCDKTAGGDDNTADNMNANNTNANTNMNTNTNGESGESGESGGNDVNNGNDGDIPTPQGFIVIRIENIDASVAELKYGNIELKASGFPSTAIAADIANTSLVNLATAPAGSLKRAFDIVMKVYGGTAPTAGLVLVDAVYEGNANIFTLDEINKSLNSYNTTEQKEGLRNSAPIAADAANAEAAKAGCNIYGGFMSDTVPTDTKRNTTPFAFTPTTGANATHPVLFCRTTITTITSGADAGDGTAQDTTVLTGGQKASCYVGATGASFTGDAADRWLNAYTAGNDFKKGFFISARGIRTDTKTIADIGLPGINKAAAFRDGITTTEMTALTAANKSALGHFIITIVRDDGFTYTPSPSPATEMVIENIDPSIAELKNGNIEIKASGFPSYKLSHDIDPKATINSVRTAERRSVKRAFDIVIKDATGRAETDGLVLVGTGDKPNANAFTLNEVNTDPMTLSVADQKEGLHSTAPLTTDADTAEAGKVGWNIYGLFMNDTKPSNAATAASDASPFAFTPTTHGGGVHPVMFCRTTVTTITDGGSTGDGTVQDATLLKGGQRASCYIGSNKRQFYGSVANSWLNETVGDTFKKKFDIAVVGIATDGKTVGSMGLTGGAASLRDGINTTEMAELTAANTSFYKKFSVSVVRDVDFTYTTP